MNEFLNALLQAVIIAAIPVIATYIVKGIRSLAAYLVEKADNDLAKRYINEAADAAATAVTFTSQTYVDALKQSGHFTAENQKTALRQATQKAKSLLTEDAAAFLEETYGDLEQYLQTLIEAQVKTQKRDNPIITSELISTAETAEGLDVDALAEAVASATAAALTKALAQGGQSGEEGHEPVAT